MKNISFYMHGVSALALISSPHFCIRITDIYTSKALLRMLDKGKLTYFIIRIFPLKNYRCLLLSWPRTSCYHPLSHTHRSTGLGFRNPNCKNSSFETTKRKTMISGGISNLIILLPLNSTILNLVPHDP